MLEELISMKQKQNAIFLKRTWKQLKKSYKIKNMTERNDRKKLNLLCLFSQKSTDEFNQNK